MARIAGALSDPTRVRIVALLSEGELSVRDIVSVLGQSQPRVSRHLKILGDAGMVSRKAEGAFAYFERSDTPGAAFLDDALAADDPALAADRDALREVRRRREAEARDYFARVAPQWDALRARHAPVARVEAAVRAALPRRMDALLDVGTGTGRILELLADRYERALGIDTSPEMLRLARTRLVRADIRHATLHQADGRGIAGDVSLPPDGFDAVVIHRVLVHADEPDRLVREAARRLAPGGILLVVDFDRHDLTDLARSQSHRRLGIADGEIADWMRAAGLAPAPTVPLEADGPDMLTVKLWRGHRPGVPRPIDTTPAREERAHA